MPKNIVIIDDDKADVPSPDDGVGSEVVSHGRVSPPSDVLLHETELSSSKKPNILRGGNRANAAHGTVASKTGAAGGAAMVAGMSRIVSVPGGFDGNQQAHTAIIRTSTGPRLDPRRLRVSHLCSADASGRTFSQRQVLTSDVCFLTSCLQDGARGDAGACSRDLTGSEDLHCCCAAAGGNNVCSRPQHPPHQHFCHWCGW